MSRATLREALRAMELEGLLRRRQGGHLRRLPPRMASSLDVNFGVTDAIRALARCRIASGATGGAGLGRRGGLLNSTRARTCW